MNAMKHFDYASYLTRSPSYPPESNELTVAKDPMDPMAAYRCQIGLGCDLLNGAWQSAFVPMLFTKDMPEHPPFTVEPADRAWINAWKFATKWGWFGYGIIAVLEIMCGGEGPFKIVCDWIDWLLVIWPCLIFTMVALLARWRVGWPIFLANLWLLIYIVQWVLKLVLLVCGAVFVWRLIDKAFAKK
jgi:hypothetical protein